MQITRASIVKLTPREIRFLKLIYPEGTISVGLSIGYELESRGYLHEVKDGRYCLTRKGIIAVAAKIKAG